MKANLRVRLFLDAYVRKALIPILLCYSIIGCALCLPRLALADSHTDFLVERGVATITGTSTTLVAGIDYTAPSSAQSAFIRITNTHHTGAGADSGSADSAAADVTAYIVDPSNLGESVTIARPDASVGNTRVAWELVQYRGVPGGDNEIIVRQQQALTYESSSTTVSGPPIAGVTHDADIAVFITGQYSPDAGTQDYNAVLSTAEWLSAADRALFRRGESGNDAVRLSYAVIEFTGRNWSVQRVPDHTYGTAGTTETESIAAVGSLTRAFLHVQKRVGIDQSAHRDFGQEVWLSGVGQVSYRLDGSVSAPNEHVAAVWVIENAQTTGDTMEVTRSNGTLSGGTSPTTTEIAIGKSLDDIAVSSIFINNSASGASSSYPEPMISARILSTTEYELWISDAADGRSYRTEIVEWPTAQRSITQNHYYFFADNGALTPLDEWPPGEGDIGENAEITELDEPLGTGDTVRLRMSLSVSDASVPAGTESYSLQYARRDSTCTAATGWAAVGEIGSTTALWRGTTTPVADGATLESLLISVSDVAGTFEEENESAANPNTILPGEDVEYDWIIENNGALEQSEYCFRMTEADGTAFEAYAFYPVIRTIGFKAESQNWKWFGDSENETPTLALAATNTAPVDVAFNDTLQLRITLAEVNGGTTANAKFRLQFSEYSDFSTSTDVAEINSCDEQSLWCYADGGSADNATITERILDDGDSCSGSIGAGCGTHNESGSSTSTFVHAAGAAKEYAFTIRHAGARVNTVYFFRVYDSANDEVVLLGSSETHPSLVTEGSSLTFSMGGIPASEQIEGVTTNINTTASTIAFGTLPLGSDLAGAHRLGINTNGTQGYQVLMYAASDLINPRGEIIQGILGSNEQPVGWNTGCNASAMSCFGYHTSDNVLQGGSTRFSPLDSYAKLSTTTPEEVAFSSSPVGGEFVDIVYRIQVRETQAAGEYQSQLRYIAVPVF